MAVDYERVWSGKELRSTDELYYELITAAVRTRAENAETRDREKARSFVIFANEFSSKRNRAIGVVGGGGREELDRTARDFRSGGVRSESARRSARFAKRSSEAFRPRGVPDSFTRYARRKRYSRTTRKSDRGRKHFGLDFTV